MSCITNKCNRHLFLEKRDNTGNSFIANVNFLVNKLNDITEINSKFSTEDIEAIHEFLNTTTREGKIVQDLEVVFKDLLKGSLHGYRKLDINLLKNFADYTDDLSAEAQRELWNNPTKQVYYSSIDVHFSDKTVLSKDFSVLVSNHHQLRDQMLSWTALVNKMGGTAIEVVPDTPIHNHELLRIYDTTLEGSTIDYVVLHAADETMCSRYAAVFSGAKDNNPQYSWMDTTSALAIVANLLPGLQDRVANADSKATQALINASAAEGLMNQAVNASVQACECASTAVAAQQDIANKAAAVAGQSQQVANNTATTASNTELARTYAENAARDAAQANQLVTDAAQELLDRVEGGIITGSYEDYPEFLRVYLDTNSNFLWGIRVDGTIEWSAGVPKPVREEIEKIGYFVGNSPEYLRCYTDANGRILWGIKKDGSVNWTKGIPDSLKNYLETFLYKDASNAIDMMAIKDSKNTVIESIDTVGNKYFCKNVRIGGDLEIKGSISGAEQIEGVHNWTKWNDLLHIPIPECAMVKIHNFTRPADKITTCNAIMEFWDMRGNYFKKKIAMGLQGNSTWNLPKPNYKFDLFADDWDGDEFSIQFGDWVAQDSFHLKAFYTDLFCGKAIVVYQWWQDICKSRGIAADTSWKQALIKMDNVNLNTLSIGEEEDLELRLDTGAKCVPDGFPCIVYMGEQFHGVFSWQIKKSKDNYHLKKNNAKQIQVDGFSNPNNLWLGNVVWNVEELRYPKNLFCEDGTIYDGDINMKEIMGTDSPLYDTFVANYTDYMDLSKGYWKDVRESGEEEYEKEYNKQIAAGNNSSYATAKAEAAQIKAEKKKVQKTLDITTAAKANVERLSNAIPRLRELDAAYDADPTPENYQAVRTEFEKYFYPDNLIDYNILVDLDGDWDATDNNCQWITWNGKVWFANVYDCNGAFGGNNMGNDDLLNNHRVTSKSRPYGYIHKYYKDEAEARYAQLRRLGVLDSDYIFGKLNDWTKRIGIEYLQKELDTWYLKSTVGNAIVNTQFWEVVLDGNDDPITGETPTYDPTVNYQIGDEVFSTFCVVDRVFRFDTTSSGIFKFRCVKPNRGVYCFKYMSLADNIWHLYKRYTAQLAIMDSVYNYSN